MKPKSNRKNTNLDKCQTPPYALDPLLPLIRGAKVWEPAAGEGYLGVAMRIGGVEVVETELERGQDFLTYEPEFDWDVIVTNPPYSIKYQWLARCYYHARPFALLMPVEALGAARAQGWFEVYGIQLILLDKRVNFKMPNKGWASHAQFPVAWFTWGLTQETISYAHIERRMVTDEILEGKGGAGACGAAGGGVLSNLADRDGVLRDRSRIGLGAA